ncbi:MAG: hypothetical protein MUC49_14335 [Raineya sp.]|jgi:hypothetical protein|nr:hypothetical protein [Raineya sp.]
MKYVQKKSKKLLKYKKRSVRRRETIVSIDSLAKKASSIAIQMAKRKEVSITYLKNNKIIRESSNGEIIILKEIDTLPIIQVKKGEKIKIF